MAVAAGRSCKDTGARIQQVRFPSRSYQSKPLKGTYVEFISLLCTSEFIVFFQHASVDGHSPERPYTVQTPGRAMFTDSLIGKLSDCSTQSDLIDC